MLQSYLLCPVPQWRESNFYRVCGAVSLPRRVRLFCETVRICSASFRQRRTPARRRRRRRRRRTASTPCGSSRSAERRCDSPPCPHPGRGRGASHAPTAPLEAAPSPSLLAPAGQPAAGGRLLHTERWNPATVGERPAGRPAGRVAYGRGRLGPCGDDSEKPRVTGRSAVGCGGGQTDSWW